MSKVEPSPERDLVGGIGCEKKGASARWQTDEWCMPGRLWLWTLGPRRARAWEQTRPRNLFLSPAWQPTVSSPGNYCNVNGWSFVLLIPCLAPDAARQPNSENTEGAAQSVPVENTDAPPHGLVVVPTRTSSAAGTHNLKTVKNDLLKSTLLG